MGRGREETGQLEIRKVPKEEGFELVIAGPGVEEDREKRMRMTWR